MEMLELYRAGALLARYPLGARALEVGRAAGCDVALEDPDLAARHWLLLRRRGTVVAFDVSSGRRQRTSAYPLPTGRDIPLGRHHALRRVQAHPEIDRSDADTDILAYPRCNAAELVVIMGRGSEARRVPISELPIHFGRGDDNDVRLSDRAVSERHVRLEPCEAGLLVRDLDSHNGTFVNGVRVQSALVNEGTAIRVGRSDLRIAAAAKDDGDEGPSMIAESSSMLQVLSEVRRIASLPWPVLIIGESGTGKEGIARSVHEHSGRSTQPFVAINAGGLTRELVESELFGHERGAFTGAAQRHRGVFEQAQHGTLFLDEVGELPLDLQARLLRALETGEIRRVGGEGSLQVDVRLVCATHRDLRAMVGEGTFRQDLYYRIARMLIEVPSLRVRPEDLRALTRRFLAEIGRDLGVRHIAPAAVARLMAHAWPGNVRELRNVLSVAAAAAHDCIELGDVERALERVSGGASVSRELDPEALRRTLAECCGNQAAAARALGIPRSTLRDRLRAL